MLCQKCGKNTATTHIKTVINGKVTEQSLCGYCAAKNGYSSFSVGGVADLLSSMLGQSVQNNAVVNAKVCNCCGSAFSDIAETGKVGCAECYTVFGDELLPYLKRIHGSVRHVGKSLGAKELTVPQSKDSLSELKTKLANLVANEKYEEAALVRDEIKRLEGEK